MDNSNNESSNQHDISSLTKSTTTKDKPTNSSINNQSTKDNIYDDETDDDADDEIFNNEKEQVKGRGGGDRGRGSNKDYSVIETFENYQDALRYMNNKKEEYSFRYPRSSSEGDKRFYHCTGFVNCPCVMYILKHADSLECSLWISNDNHYHKESNKKRLPLKSVRKIKEFIGNGVRSNKRIIEKLKELKLPQVSAKQISNFKQREKKQILGDDENSLTDLITWCENNKTIPINDDKVFCGAFDYVVDEDDKIKSINIFLTTKRLISFTTKSSNHIATDGTYKLTFNNNVIINVGTNDLGRQFHPFGCLVTTTENTEDYAFMFNAVKRLSKDLYQFDYEPTILLADAASYITNAFKQVFKLEKRVTCWFHVSKDIKKKLSSIFSCKNIDKETKTKIKNDLYLDIVQFQHVVKLDEFIPVARLMINKWRKKYVDNIYVNDFIEYFVKQWLSPKRMGWFDHFCDLVPITDNSIESTNRYVKEEDTGIYRPRPKTVDFIKIIQNDFIYHWSTDRNPIVIELDDEDIEVEKPNLNLKKYYDEPNFELSDYTIAYQWNKLDKKVKKIKRGDNYYYCTPSSDKIEELSSESCHEYFDSLKVVAETINFDEFNDYLKQSNKLHYISINETNWKLSKCSCWWWCKNFKCKHVIGICSRLKLLKFETVHKSIPIGKTRGPGRPKLTKSALQLQGEEYVKSDEELDEENLKQSKEKKSKKKKSNDNSSSSDDEFVSKFNVPFADISNKSKMPVISVEKKNTKSNSKPMLKKVNNLKKNQNDSVSDISESVAVSQSVACSSKSIYTTTANSATSNSKISITRISNKSQINQDKSVYLNNDKSLLRRSSRLSK